MLWVSSPVWEGCSLDLLLEGLLFGMILIILNVRFTVLAPLALVRTCASTVKCGGFIK